MRPRIALLFAGLFVASTLSHASAPGPACAIKSGAAITNGSATKSGFAIESGSAITNGSATTNPSASTPVSAGPSVPARPSVSTPATASASSNSGPATAIFSGGCFWCEETAFEGLDGVLSVTSGYTGGTKRNPTYEEVSAGRTGHAESVKVVYDPARISYERLLHVYWHSIDPLQRDGQFCDHGTQYRSAIFYQTENQRKAAEDSKRKLEEQPRFKGQIATQIAAASAFYPAEEYHQDYYKKDPGHYLAYRLGCGRDARLKELWGDAAVGGH